LLQKIPPQIAVPLLEVSALLGLPPTGTYTSLCLWNYRKICPAGRLDDPSNLAVLFTFTGTVDEEWFYMVSVAIEARGAKMIPHLLEGIKAAQYQDRAGLIRSLERFVEGIYDIRKLLERMYEKCDPHIFYYHIRPFLAGSKNMADAGLPKGVWYDDGTGFRQYRRYSGGSNAQSPLIHFFDAVLGIKHDEVYTQRDCNNYQRPLAHGFLAEMRNYMFGPHRLFLDDISPAAKILEYVVSRPYDRVLQSLYDSCLDMLRTLRDRHIQMVTRYIVVESCKRQVSPCPLGQCPSDGTGNIAQPGAEGRTDVGTKFEKLRGTGGTALLLFLKQVRNRTRRSMC
jgi:indoleamine 2,3-dioxygenase